jgi:hypothetical protein
VTHGDVLMMDDDHDGGLSMMMKMVLILYHVNYFAIRESITHLSFYSFIHIHQSIYVYMIGFGKELHSVYLYFGD